MKKSVILFVLMFFNSNFYAQEITVTSSQATAVPGGINVNLQTYCSTLFTFLESNYTINGNQINLSVCYNISILLFQSDKNEDFFIATPNPDTQNYIVNLTVYSSQSPGVCDYSLVEDSITLTNDSFSFINNDVKLSPNPTVGSFQIDIGNQNINSIKFYDTIGKLVKVTNNLNNDISNLQNGLYYIILETENGNITKKIILQK